MLLDTEKDIHMSKYTYTNKENEAIRKARVTALKRIERASTTRLDKGKEKETIPPQEIELVSIVEAKDKLYDLDHEDYPQQRKTTLLTLAGKQRELGRGAEAQALHLLHSRIRESKSNKWHREMLATMESVRIPGQDLNQTPNPTQNFLNNLYLHQEAIIAVDKQHQLLQYPPASILLNDLSKKLKELTNKNEWKKLLIECCAALNAQQIHERDPESKAIVDKLITALNDVIHCNPLQKEKAKNKEKLFDDDHFEEEQKNREPQPFKEDKSIIKREIDTLHEEIQRKKKLQASCYGFFYKTNTAAEEARQRDLHALRLNMKRHKDDYLVLVKDAKANYPSLKQTWTGLNWLKCLFPRLLQTPVEQALNNIIEQREVKNNK